MNRLEQRLETLKRRQRQLKWFFNMMVVTFVVLAAFTAFASFRTTNILPLVPVMFLGFMLYGALIRLVSMKDLIETLEDVMSDRLGHFGSVHKPVVPAE